MFRRPRSSELHQAAINRTPPFDPAPTASTDPGGSDLTLNTHRELSLLSADCLAVADRHLTAAVDGDLSTEAMQRAYAIGTLMQRITEDMSRRSGKYLSLSYVRRAVQALDGDPAELSESRYQAARGWLGQARATGAWREHQAEAPRGESNAAD